MITREPQIGEEIEYNSKNIRGDRGAWQGQPGENTWKSSGLVVKVEGNICYTFHPGIDTPPGEDGYPPGANNSFIWRFHDRLNSLHRIKE